MGGVKGRGKALVSMVTAGWWPLTSPLETPEWAGSGGTACTGVTLQAWP